MEKTFGVCIELLLLVKDKKLLDNSKFIYIKEICFSKKSDSSPEGWIYVARVSNDHYNELCNDSNIIIEKSKTLSV